MKHKPPKGYNKVKTGTFTTAYIYEEKQEVILLSRDNVKECMSFGWFPECALFPAIERLELMDDHGFQMYKMPLYKTDRSPKSYLSTEAYRTYRELRKFYEGFTCKMDLWEAVEASKLSEEVKEALQGAYDALCNYANAENIRFEISPRNVAGSAEGSLILLDCFFLRSSLTVARSSKNLLIL